MCKFLTANILGGEKKNSLVKMKYDGQISKIIAWDITSEKVRMNFVNGEFLKLSRKKIP